MTTLLSISIAVLAGLLMTRVLKVFRLPAVTAYLIAGILIGPFCLGQLNIEGIGFTSAESVSALSLISEVALGFIAFSLGSEFRLKDLKKTGKPTVVIGVVQALLAAAFVDVAMLIIHMIIPDQLSLAQAITIGAIATATAPAATLMVVRQYKARGPVTQLLIPIVALDDAVGLIVFAISFGIAKTLTSGQVDLASIILTPLIEIVGSVVLGAVLGWLLTQLEKLFNSNTNRLTMTITFVFLAASLAMLKFQIGGITVGFSSLLVCMMLGSVFCNLCPLYEDIMSISEKWTAPLLALFFVLSGAQLQLDVFMSGAIVIIGVVYILCRSAGKITGASLGANVTKQSPTIKKYLGITLLPQAGVALGMGLVAMTLGPEGALIRNITLFSVLVYEIIGPVLTKFALTKAGEIQPKPQEVIDRRKTKLEEQEEREKSQHHRKYSDV